jgi:prepilin-type N-terminal cleavage/methylation domain-containing protein
MTNKRSPALGFTLIELMIVVALVAVVVSLAGPPFRDYIAMQRLRGIHAQLLTDLNYARSEAVSRGTFVQVRFQTGSGLSCYIIYSRLDVNTTSPCDCTAAADSRCSSTSSTNEIKTVVVNESEGVSFAVPTSQTTFLTVNPRTGGADLPAEAEMAISTEFAVETKLTDNSRRLKSTMTSTGRVQFCSPSGTVAGMTAC